MIHDDSHAQTLARQYTQTLLMRRRQVTLARANAALPLVRTIVRDIQLAHRQASDIHSRLKARLTPEQRDDIERQLDGMVDRLHRYVEEITELGADVKDYQLGLIDFVATHQNRPVYLCWRPGDASIRHFHEAEADYARRLPVELLQE
jgi:hypothetical protein